MNIKIKTTLITLEIEDEPVTTSSLVTMHTIPSLLEAVKTAINEAIRLHNEVNK